MLLHKYISFNPRKFVWLCCLSLSLCAGNLCAGKIYAAENPAIAAEPNSSATAGAGVAKAAATTGAAKSGPALSSSSTVLQGHTIIEVNNWKKYYDAAASALNKRLYEEASKKIHLAMKELQTHGNNDTRMLESKLILAKVYLGTEQYKNATRLFNDCLDDAKHLTSGDSALTADILDNLAKCYLAEAKMDKAELDAKQALTMRTKLLAADDHDLGMSEKTLGSVYLHANKYDDALTEFKKSLSILEKHSGYEEMDYADALHQTGVTLFSMDNAEESKSYFDRALSLKEKAIKYNLPVSKKGLLKFTWEQDMPGSRQIFDRKYPLKYMTVGGLRVACTLVRSERLVAAIVSLANCSRQRLELGVGPVKLQEVLPRQHYLVHIDPTYLDMALEEEHVVNLTWRRGWLNHIQKTREIPGYLSHGILDPDNFLGNNQFGIYGSWGTSVRNTTPFVTREKYFAQRDEPIKDPDLAEFINSSSTGLRPVYIDPGDARTGLVFWLRERFDLAKLKILIGHVLFEFPFTAIDI